MSFFNYYVQKVLFILLQELKVKYIYNSVYLYGTALNIGQTLVLMKKVKLN